MGRLNYKRGKNAKKFKVRPKMVNYTPLPRLIMSNKLFRCKIMCQQGITTLAGETAWSFSLNFPTYWCNTAGTFTQLGSICTSFTRYINLFDQFRVNKLTVMTLPAIVFNSPASVVYTAGEDKALYHYNDQDDFTAVTLVKIMNEGVLPSTIVAGKPFTKTMKPVKKNNLWKNTQYLITGAVLPSSAVANNAAVLGVNQYGSQKYLMTNGTATENIGRQVIVWDVTFRGINAT